MADRRTDQARDGEDAIRHPSHYAQSPRSMALGISLALHAGALAMLLAYGSVASVPPHSDPGDRLVVTTFAQPEKPAPAAKAKAKPPSREAAAKSSVLPTAVPLPLTQERRPPPSLAIAAPVAQAITRKPDEKPVPARESTPAPQAIGASGSEVSSYVAQLWRRIDARRPGGNGLRGTSVILFRLDRNGRLLSLKVARSSNIATLDRLALRTVRESAPFPTPPGNFSEAQLEFSVSVNFL